MKKKLLSIIMVSFVALQVVACGSADVASAEGLKVEELGEVAQEPLNSTETEVAKEPENATETETVATNETQETQTETATQSQASDFVGQYYVGDGNLSIAQQEDGKFLIEVWWGINAAQHGEWVMHGTYDGVDTITYSDCVKHEYTLNDNGEVDTDETIYTDGTGNIKIVNNSTIMWNDDMEHVADDVEMTR